MAVDRAGNKQTKGDGQDSEHPNCTFEEVGPLPCLDARAVSAFVVCALACLAASAGSASATDAADRGGRETTIQQAPGRWQSRRRRAAFV